VQEECPRGGILARTFAPRRRISIVETPGRKAVAPRGSPTARTSITRSQHHAATPSTDRHAPSRRRRLPGHRPAGGDDVVRKLTGNLSAAGAERLSVEAPVGEFRIEGAATSTISAAIDVRCRRPVRADCRKKAQEIELLTGHRGDVATVAVRGWPQKGNDGLSLTLRLTMPHDLAVVGEFGVGELVVVGLEAGARLELGVGEIDVEVPAASVRRASLEVGVGEASLVVGGRRIEGKGFIGRQVDWTNGRGSHLIDAECGVGEIEVRLTD
jgi:hypothetical protein